MSDRKPHCHLKRKNVKTMGGFGNNFCILSIHDPDFNEGKEDKFYNAFQRAIVRGDFR